MKDKRRTLAVAMTWAADPATAKDAFAQVHLVVTNTGPDAYNVVVTAGGPLAGIDSYDLPTIAHIEAGQRYETEATVHLTTGTANAPRAPSAVAKVHGKSD